MRNGKNYWHKSNQKVQTLLAGCADPVPDMVQVTHLKGEGKGTFEEPEI